MRRFVLLLTLLVAVPFAPADAATPTPTVTAQGSFPAATGTGLATNHDSEPGIAAEPDGTLWATSTVISDPRQSGQDIWKSTDGGRTWAWVAAPFNIPNKNPLFGGEDSDIAVATAPNALGRVNVYAASLYALASPDGLIVGDISLAVTVDGGHSWIVHPLAAEVPLDDRPWLAADGPCRVYLTYHALPTEATVVNVYDLCNPLATIAGLTLAPVASTRYAQLLLPALLGQGALYVTVGFGKTMVDTSPTSPFEHNLYIPMMDCPGLTLGQEIARAEARDSNCPAGVNAEVYLAVGTEGGTTWTLGPVARTSNREVPTWGETVAVDGRGCVYLTWSDNHHSFLDVSCTAGRTWQPVVPLGGDNASVDPTITAAADGHVAVAWYGADRPGDANDLQVMGAPGSTGAARWSLQGAMSNDGGQTWSAAATLDPLVHTGVLCTRGDACTIANSRTLLDDFGAVTSPRSHAVTFVYGNDQPGGTFATVGTRWVTLAPVF
jgi:predicted lipoprotein with Yx(FWY)xxD motif